MDPTWCSAFYGRSPVRCLRRHPEAAQALVKNGAVAASSIEDFAMKLKAPRAIWMMVRPPWSMIR